jgi:predicted alpha/beta-fold hydrolase
LPSAHLQTIWPVLVAPRPEVALKRQTWDTPDGDFIDLDFLDLSAAANRHPNPQPDSDPPPAPGTTPIRAAAPLWVIFHGLEGSSNSHYARSMLAYARDQGHHAVVPHFRGCSGRINARPRAYHSGDSWEIDWILRRMALEHAGHPIFAVGVSLGGNALLKWLGEQGTAADFVCSAAAVCPPQNLRAGAVSLSRGLNRGYSEYFLRTLRPKSLAMLERFPGLFDGERVRQARNFFDFDDTVTAPLHGFASCEDYWAKSSCRPFLGGIRVPTLVINALNDPFMPKDQLARPDQVSPHVTLEYPETGGHVGFPGAGRGQPRGWLPQRLACFLSQRIGV